MSQTLLLILEKIASKDKDFRYMATSDLLNELQKDNFKADAEMEKKLCTAILNQLEDPSGDISGLAVKCLGFLVRKVSEARAEELVKTLCDKVITVPAKKDKEQQRDIASIGLKTIIAEITGGTLANHAANIMTNKLLEGATKDNYEVAGDSLDILGEVLTKFGGLVGAEHVRIRTTLAPLLDDGRTALRKRALHCLAALCVYAADPLLDDMVGALLARLRGPGLKPDVARTYVQAVGQVSRSVGYRFGRHLGAALPLVVAQCEGAAEGDDELRELCLQALEGFVVRCPHDARGHLDALLAAALRYLRHDPNFADDDDDDMGGGSGSDAGGSDIEEDDDDDAAYSDDEDASWKVRRASAKALAAATAAYPDALPTIYAKAAGELVNRFREREENVKGDVFAAYITLARQVGAVGRLAAPADPASPLAKLRGDVPGVVRAVARQLKEKSPKTRVGAFALLRELAAVAPAEVAAQLPALTPGITAALSDRSSTASGLKIEALNFTRAALAAGPSGASAPAAQLKAIMPALLPCASDRYYKVAAEALRVAEVVMTVLRPVGQPASPIPADVAGAVPGLFAAMRSRLAAQDQDQEVKDAAITGTAVAVAQLADVLAAEVPGVLKMLLERLRNEITRLTAVRAFGTLAASPAVELGGAAGVLEAVLGDLTSFLRKALRPLRAASLGALEALAARYGASFDGGACSALVEEATSLVADTDLPLASAALRLMATLVRTQPSAAAAVAAKALPAALGLVRSPLLQGGALDTLRLFLTTLVSSGTPGAAYDVVVAQLLAVGVSAGKEGAGKAAQISVAQCVAALCSTAGGAATASTTSRLLGDVTAPGDVAVQRQALFCLGEIGRLSDLSGNVQVEGAVSASLQSDAEEIRGAASLALGGITCGALGKYLPSLLSSISAAAPTPKRHYLLLTALAEVLATLSSPASTKGLSDAEVSQVLSLLLASAGSGEEEGRAVVAECLGRLALLAPAPVLAAVQQHAKAPEPNMRAVVVSAVKHMVVERPHAVDGALGAVVGPLLGAGMADEDRHVRRAAVVSLSAVAHQKAGLVAGGGVLGGLMAGLYAQTAVREDLIRTVDLGPFKHKIDDGLELRKAAFECLDILLDAPGCRASLDTPTFLQHLQSGLGDHPDVKAPCHLMVAKLAAADPAGCAAGAERLCEPLEKTLTARLKSDAVKQEVDRHEDMLRSCLRAVDALAQLPGISACAPFASLMKRVVLVSPLKERYLAVERERLEAEGAGAGGDAMDLS